MNAQDLIFIGGSFRVACLEKATGRQVWESILKKGFFTLGESYVSLLVDRDVLYAHTSNVTYCLNIQTGEILWETKLPNIGRAVASVAMLGARTSIDEAQALIRERARESSGGD